MYCLLQDDIAQCMPAHISPDQVGQGVCSDGAVVDESRWAAKQIVDLLAKQATEPMRTLAMTRKWLKHRESQFSELLVFLGKLPMRPGTMLGMMARC